MSVMTEAGQIAWWREPTKDQWLAWIAAWLGWTLDSFDFTIFLLIIKPIADYFQVPLVDVTFVFTITLWMRLVGAVSSGWLGDRLGRKLPLMISILGYSLCNFIAGFSPAFWFLFLFRALLGFFMGAEWPAGAALAMEQWPIRSRGLMSGILQGSWGIGFLLSSVVYGFLFTFMESFGKGYGWRGCLWIGVLPALTVVYVRLFVKEPPVWVENRRRQREENREVKVPLFSIFKRGMIGNTALACWWMAGGLVTYYSINGMFATHLQKDLGLSPALIATPIIIANAVVFMASMFWGYMGDRIGRRWAMIIPGLLGIPVAFCYMLSGDYWVIVVGYVVQGALLGGGAGAHVPSYMNERFPTEVRATAAAFCYHLGTILGGIVPPVVTYFALNYHLGFSIPMLIGCVIGGGSWCLALFLGPETKGKEMVADLVLA
jgi:SHS family lactate transporter-like MFS transporter